MLAVTGLIFVLPCLLLPFVTLGKYGNVRSAFLLGSAEGFWHYGLRALSGWVLFCGLLAPVALLGLLAFTSRRSNARDRSTDSGRRARLASILEYWSMPEVHVLGILVAFFKLGDVVGVSVGPGLWCYGAMAWCMLLAWRSHALGRPAELPPQR